MVKRPYLLLLIFLVTLNLVTCKDDNGKKGGNSPEDHSQAVGSSQAHQSKEGKSKEETHKKRRKPAPVPTCEELLQDTKDECYRTVPVGYDPESCKFNWVENEDCDWEFICESTLPETPEEAPTTTEDPSSSSSSSVESCETDRKISFSNCFINVDGFVKHSRAKLCD